MKHMRVDMYKIIVLFIMVFFLSGGLMPTVVDAVSKPTKIENLSDGGGFILYTFQEKIHPSMPEFSFAIYALQLGRSSDYQSRRIIITETDTKNIVQEIPLLNLSRLINYPTTSDRETLGFVIEDMNFDGYKDIRIVAFMPGGPRIPYFYWFWNTKEEKFVRNIDLEEITAPVFDPINKTIHSSANVSEIQSYDLIYKYVDSVPITKENYMKNLSYLDRMESNLETQNEAEKKKTLNNCYKSWNEELNNIFGHLLKEITPEMRETLRTEQKNWLIEREKSAKTGDGTYSLLLATKNRTLELLNRFFGESKKR